MGCHVLCLHHVISALQHYKKSSTATNIQTINQTEGRWSFLSVSKHKVI